MKSLQFYPWIACKRITCCLLLLLTVPFYAAAQQVSVSANSTKDCPPFTVQFNATLDNGYSSYEWDFGVGANVSNNPAPSRIFQTPGVYHVTLTAIYSGIPVKSTIDITVYKKPVVAFTTSLTAGCAPMDVTFTDHSIPGDGAIKDITWDFGDGSGATGTVATHTYTKSGTYNVISAVTNTQNCKSNIDPPVQIKVQDTPEPSFTADKTQSCTAPLTVHFINTTVNISGAPYTYVWDYGDGATGTNDTHTYNQEGKYTVTLKATSTAGCSKTTTKTAYIVVEKIKPGFTFSNACLGQDISFTNTTVPKPDAVIWAFPDGTTATSQDVVKQFPAPGDYLVKMQASLDGCTEEVQQTVHVNPAPQINPAGTPLNACIVPFTTTFTAQSQDASQWLWNFGDGSTSALENPSHTYTGEGTYPVTLTATNAYGCTKTATMPGNVTILKPVVTIRSTPVEGCLPLPVDFSATLNIPEPITGYQWNFGDGATSTAAQPQHTYTTEGTFTVTLNIQTATGCTAAATTIIRTGKLPIVDFDATPRLSCAIDPVQFTNLSQPRGTGWTWIFPQDNSGSTEENPKHQFGEIGLHDVILIVDNNGCKNQLTKTKFVKILPPIAKFTTQPDCTDPYHRKFTDNSDFGPDPTVPKSWRWEFGENGAVSTLQSPDFTYTTPGIKLVKLVINNGICESTITTSVNIIDEKPVIHADKPWICVGQQIKISMDPMIAGNINEYTWNWGDGTIQSLQGFQLDPANGITHVYNKTGTFTIQLTITDKNGCVRTSPPVTIDVNGATPDFDFAGKRCKNEVFTFTDKSTVNTGNQIMNWNWDFGDGTPSENYTVQPLATPHTYASADDYTITLTATDKFGCAVPVKKTVSLEKAVAAFAVPSNIACLNTPFVFVAQTAPSIADYAWDFGDNTTGSGPLPSKTYAGPGKYNVTLKITTNAGCTDAITKPNVIRVPDPKASFTIPASLDLCPPVKVLFTNTSTDFEKSVWDFGDNSTSTKNDPDDHIYIRAKTYQVVLTVYSEGGCSNSTPPMDVTIKGPDGTINITPTQGCVPLQASISANALKTVQFIWDFDDGTVVTTTTPVSPQHIYTQPGIYYPRVSLVDDQGCKVQAIGNDKIVADKATADFTVDRSLACGGGVVTFKNTSKTTTKDLLALDYTSDWNFGLSGTPGNTSTTPDGSFTYPQPGTFNAKLQVTSAYGCKDEKTIQIIIPPQPEPVIAPVAPLCVSGKYSSVAVIKNCYPVPNGDGI